jgi:NAD(P)-dependent dehydrogenase (short-subunit alcohol dehydrogenase family)
MGRLHEKVVIVTGAAGGIGATCVRRFAEEGARVVVADIVGDAAKVVAEEIVADGGDAIAVTVDVSDEDAVEAMIGAAVQQFGRLDVLHNNAAIQNAEFMARDNAVADLDVDVFDRTIAVNLRGYLLGAKHAIPRMLEVGGGSIINTSSRAGSDGELRLTSYGVSKAGVEILTKYIATQYGKQGIRCNAMVIAGVLTERLLENTDEAYRARVARHLLRTSLATTDEIANVALFLASDESSYVTGHLLAVDGGWGAHSPRFADSLEAAQQSQ